MLKSCLRQDDGTSAFPRPGSLSGYLVTKKAPAIYDKCFQRKAATPDSYRGSHGMQHLKNLRHKFLKTTKKAHPKVLFGTDGAATPDSYRGSHGMQYLKNLLHKKTLQQMLKGLKKGGDILSHGMQYHLR